MLSSNRYCAIFNTYTEPSSLEYHNYLPSLTNSFPFYSDPPDPPLDLFYDTLAGMESSAVVQWRSPVLTGGSGVSITRYTVTVDGQMLQTVSHCDRDIFAIVVSELDYNTTYGVAVTAINSCGLSSSPATTNISIIFNFCGLSSSPATTNISLFKSKSKIFICGKRRLSIIIPPDIPTTTPAFTNINVSGNFMECQESLSTVYTVATITCLISLPVGIVLGCCVVWLTMRIRNKRKQKKREQGAIYEEPALPVETTIPLSENQAYGQVSTRI